MQKQPGNRALWAVALVVVILGAGAAVYALTMQPAKEDTATNSSTSSTSSSAAASDAKVGSTVIKFTDKGFDKSTYSSKAGEAVTVKNDSSMDLQFSSGPHPTHTEHPELNEGILRPGESAPFTPSGPGTYSFHDHLHDQYTGMLVVK
jgi:hypothetical protein